MSNGLGRICALGLSVLIAASHTSRASAQERKPPDAVRGEPSVREVLEMAQEAAKRASPERTRSLVRRARLSGLVPTLRVGAKRGLQQDLSASSGGDTERTNASLGDDVSVDASLTFDLPRLIFAPEEVRLLSVDRWLVQDRKKLFDEVVRLYFQRRRLLMEQAQRQGQDPELEIAIAESEALLDAFTDGAFGEALAEARKTAPGGGSRSTFGR